MVANSHNNSLPPTVGYVLYCYSDLLAARTRLEASRWLAYGEFQTKEEAIYEMWQYQQNEPFLKMKITRESIFV